MPMRRFPAIHTLLSAACLLLAGACGRVPQPGEGREIPVLLNLDTKASGNYEGTFRVALFDNNDEFTGATGTVFLINSAVSGCYFEFADSLTGEAQ